MTTLWESSSISFSSTSHSIVQSCTDAEEMINMSTIASFLLSAEYIDSNAFELNKFISSSLFIDPSQLLGIH